MLLSSEAHVLILALIACQDSQVSVYNTAPTASITAPEDGATVEPSSLVELTGVVGDEQQDAETLEVVWTAGTVELGTSVADAEGVVYLATTELSGGTQVVTLTATDESGESSQDSITLEVGQGDPGVPVVTLVGPTEGSEHPDGDLLTVVATATDSDQAWETLDAWVISGADGTLWTGNPGSNGAIEVELGPPSQGTYRIEVLVQDEDGQTGSASAEITVFEDGRPDVEILTPDDNGEADGTEGVLLEGTVEDDLDDADMVAVKWTSDVDGLFHEGFPDSDGSTVVQAPLSMGQHVVTLSGTDSEGKSGAHTIEFEVYDPLDRDDDYDGYTENEGDCDDGDSTLSPGWEEVCDDVDNNCDGVVNDPWADDYEDDDDVSVANDFGEIDDGNPLTEVTVTISGLTLHTADDEDWFLFDVDDTWDDNADFTITIDNLDSATSWVGELYEEDGDYLTSDSGTSKLTISYSGSIWDYDEDKYYLRVYASSWGGESTCETAYSVEISAR